MADFFPEPEGAEPVRKWKDMLELSQTRAQLKLCTQCILPETFPGIKFDEKGICNHCAREESAIAKAPAKKEDYRQRRLKHFDRIKRIDWILFLSFIQKL